jgi:CheY-like chemotaxis protein
MLSGQLDGWDVAERCRESNPKLPVVYTTGYSFREHRPDAGSHILSNLGGRIDS